MRRAGFLLVAYACTLFLLVVSPVLWVVLVAEFVSGFFYFAIMTSMQTLLQQIVDEAKRGRVMSLFQVAWAGMSPFGALLLGTLGSAVGLLPAVSLASSVCLAYGIWLVFRHASD